MFLQGDIELNISFESKWPGSQLMFFSQMKPENRSFKRFFQVKQLLEFMFLHNF